MDFGRKFVSTAAVSVRRWARTPRTITKLGVAFAVAIGLTLPLANAQPGEYGHVEWPGNRNFGSGGSGSHCHNSRSIYRVQACRDDGC